MTPTSASTENNCSESNGVSLRNITEISRASNSTGETPENYKSNCKSLYLETEWTLQDPSIESTPARSEIPEDSWVKTLAQVLGPLFIAGFGMVGAGIFLVMVLGWPVFVKIPEFVIVITPLLGLKGNLEMTVASRHCTYANLGYMDTPKKALYIFVGDLTLTQTQSTVVGFLAAIVAILLGLITSNRISFTDATILCSCSMLTAAASSVILGSIMMGVVLIAIKFNINPDNVATPIAASLGDTLTLFILSGIGNFVYSQSDDTKKWLPGLIMGCLVLVVPLWILICYRNKYSQSVLFSGWSPIIIAMIISSGAGMILGHSHQKFLGIELYQPVINGVGGNLVSIQASRISTRLHRDCEPGTLPSQNEQKRSICVSPWSTFFSQGTESTIAIVLLLMVIPEHLVFVTVTHFVSRIGGQDSQYSILFLILYIVAALIQVALLLYIAQILINIFWSRKWDPDVHTIPFVTSLGDLFGTALLLAAYELLSLF